MNDFNELRTILDKYEINYQWGHYYTDNDEQDGYWIEINGEINFNKKGEKE